MLAAALMVMLLSFGATTRTASAQGQITACQTSSYTVDLTPLAGRQCFPFKFYTSWNGGSVIWTSFGGFYMSAGIFVESPPVAVGTPLDYINVFGVSIPPVYPQQVTINTACGPVCVRVCLDANRCLYIKVYPGPCPGPLLPCP